MSEPEPEPDPAEDPSSFFVPDEELGSLAINRQHRLAELPFAPDDDFAAGSDGGTAAAGTGSLVLLPAEDSGRATFLSHRALQRQATELLDERQAKGLAPKQLFAQAAALRLYPGPGLSALPTQPLQLRQLAMCEGDPRHNKLMCLALEGD